MRWPVACFFLLVGTTSQAASLWEHNGSVVLLEANGAARKFVYSSPRSGLPVTRGTLLFSGKKDGNSYSGVAYIFSPRCGPRSYPVSGPVSDDQRTVTMSGRAPRLDARCNVVDYRDDVLTFTFRDPDQSGDVRVGSNREFITIGSDTAVLHRDPEFQIFGKRVYLDEVGPEDPGHDGQLVVTLSEITPNPFVIRRSVGLNNGFAVVEKGERWIVYDPMWYGGLGGGSRELLMGHEIGHHVCGHQDGLMQQDPWAKELEADRYAGSVMKRLGYKSPHDVIEAARANYTQPESPSHPGPAARVQAVLNGYYNGSPCESRGFVKPRVITPEEKAEFEKGLRSWCMELVQNWCSSKEGFDYTVWRHSLMSSDCDIPPLVRAPGFGTAFPGVDCKGGGRFTAGRFKQE